MRNVNTSQLWAKLVTASADRDHSTAAAIADELVSKKAPGAYMIWEYHQSMLDGNTKSAYEARYRAATTMPYPLSEYMVKN